MVHRRSVAFVAMLGLLPFVLVACSKATSSTDPRTQAPLVQVGTVENSTRAERSFTGIVAARVQSDLGFRVPGKVLERLIDNGQTVKRGQPLMRIDPANLRLATLAQEEAVSAAKARAHQTSEDEARYRDLVSAGGLASATQGKLRRVGTASSKRPAQPTLPAIRRGTMSVADGAGCGKTLRRGQVVAAGQVVVRVAHAGRREAVIELPETLRPAIGSTGRAALYGTGLSGSAKLRQLSDAANRQTRTFEARYVLEGSLADAPLGSTISIQLSNGQRDSALQVPIGAISDSGKGPGVWLVEGETPRVTWRAVQIARLSDEAASVVGNLKVGDRVVALGAHLLHEGDHVRLRGGATPAVDAKGGAAS